MWQIPIEWISIYSFNVKSPHDESDHIHCPLSQHLAVRLYAFFYMDFPTHAVCWGFATSIHRFFVRWHIWLVLEVLLDVRNRGPCPPLEGLVWLPVYISYASLVTYGTHKRWGKWHAKLLTLTQSSAPLLVNGPMRQCVKQS